MPSRGWIVVAVLAAGCGARGGPTADVEGIVRDARTGRPVGGARVRAEDGGESRARADGTFRVRAPYGGQRTIVASAADKCPGRARVLVPAAGVRNVVVHLYPRLELDGDRVDVGFDTTVRLQARTRCDEAARVRWKQVSGRALGARLRTEEAGRMLELRTHPIEQVARLDPRIGVVALSRLERGDYRLEAELVVRGRALERQSVRVVAAATSAGVYQVPTGADVYLNGGAGAPQGWTLLSKPDGSRAEMSAGARVARFRPDRFGQYLVRAEPSAVEMNIQAGAYEEVPRDCGREGCHAPEDRGWQTTKHAAAFRRGVEGQLGLAFDERCWTCHATGVDPGVANGGLHETAAAMGFVAPRPVAGAWDALPRRIRRHASVWCSACHGPGRILPPQFHWEYGAKFQAGVCARCHDVVGDPDAPHTSPQVAEWRLAAMSRFVRDLQGDDPALREGCARCHSAQGFVEWRKRGRDLEPERATVAAIACTTCHDPHDGTRPHALRVFDDSEPVAGAVVHGMGAGALCVSCHRSAATPAPGVAPPRDVAAAPHAPNAEVLLGRGARLTRGAPGGPHAAIAGSCAACHMKKPGDRDPIRGRAGGHTFSVRDLAGRDGRGALLASACASSGCHASEHDLERIGGVSDRDGDRVTGTIAEEWARALGAARQALDAAVMAARVSDRCGTPRAAARVVEHDVRMLLADAQGKLLGDCDGDGRIGAGETATDAASLPARVRDAAWDVLLVERDGSRGAHNAAFSFRVLRAARAALR